MDYHCDKHHTFQPVCDGCQRAKRNYWLEKSGRPPEPPPPAPAPSLGARVSDPDTSHDAVPDVATAGSIQAAIIDALNRRGPMTEEGIANHAGVERTSLSPQLRPMIRAGQVVDMLNPDGTKMKRRNTSGKLALVRGLPKHQSGLPAPSDTMEDTIDDGDEL